MLVSSSRTPTYGAAPRPFAKEGIVTRWPLTTIILLIVMVLVFGIELNHASLAERKGLYPLTETLLGGLSGQLMAVGQWYRLLSYAFLHANGQHLFLNAVALGLAGCALERIVGHAWVFCIFALGAVCGGAGALLAVPQSTVTVGASGGIMALLGALFMTSFRLPPGRVQRRAQFRALYLGVPGLIPHHSLGHLQVSYGAHISGAVFGVVIGSLLLVALDDDEARPPLEVGALLLSAMAALAFGSAGYAAARDYHLYGPSSRFIPPAELPQQRDIAARGNELATLYPMDARAHVFAAIAQLHRKDARGAETQFRQALDLEATASGFYAPEFASRTHGILAVLLAGEGRRGEAVMMAQPFCQLPRKSLPSAQLTALVSAAHLCTAEQGME